ncbi:MAG: glycosyltransferase family 2 protein [Verrucomicrobia bacterium]|nr:MAG: glycosyltransferase family 2 protein [Verrucomicrobiota bacterium]
MKKISSLFAGAAERTHALNKQIASAESRYYWWFDHPIDWERPMRTLYVTGWCVSREGKEIRAMRARFGRQEFAANYGIERKDVGAAVQRIGFAIAIPLPAGKSQVFIEVQEADCVWRAISTQAVFGASDGESAAPIDPKYFIPNPGANPRIEFWLDRPLVWPKKIRYLKVSGWCLAISGDEITEVRARMRKNIFPARFGKLRPDIGLRYDNRPGALRSGFSLNATIPRGRSQFIMEARSGEGPWETFFLHPLRGPIFREQLNGEWKTAGDYARWIRCYDRLEREDVQRIREQIAKFHYSPMISVLLPVYNSNLRWLRRAILSVQKQLYPRWELCVVDDASTDRKLWPFLQRCARRDPRINVMRRTENGHISAASNDALRLANGDFVALLDHDDELAPTALYFVALALNKNRDLQLLYSDEDKLDAQNRRSEPYFKSDWNPELVLAQNFISHLSVYRTDLIRRLGGFRIGLEGSQDYDLALRCIEQIRPKEIEHLPWVLYHWRAGDQSTASSATAKPYAQEAARRAVQEHLERTGIAGTVVPSHGVYLQTKYAFPIEHPLVSIIIPTRDRTSCLQKCLDSIFEKTDYRNYEVIVLDNESHEAETLEFLAELTKYDRVRVERIDGTFNYSRLNNRGVELSRGSFIALLNNDVEVINDDWLSEMVSRAMQPEVAMVGARLWYPNGTIQHGGVILGAGGIAGHAHVGLRRGEPGYFARANLAQNVSAVTAACALVRREVYLQLGGFDESLAVTFNDIDFCLRLRQAGYRIVWTPHAELIHHESASRGFDDSTPKQVRFLGEVDYMNSKWGDMLQRDPFYNPNLSLGENLFTLAFPPRTIKPWQSIAP